MKSDETAPPIIAVRTTKEISAGESLIIDRLSGNLDCYIQNTIDNERELQSEKK